MEKQITAWYSPSLDKEMPVATYGHFGFALLLVPTAGADYLEYERFGLIEAIAPFITAGKIKVFSINSINNESWLHADMLPEHKAIRHNQFNRYVYEEVIPFVRNSTSMDTMVYVCGASLGAYHAMNLFLKRPDIINGTISMSGVYDLTDYTKGYWDEQVYYNSPIHYIPNLADAWYLDKIRASHHIHIYSGSGKYEDPEANKRFSRVLWDKGIWHDFQLWGSDMKHDWPTWRMMLPYILENKF
ncbi:MAG: esterase family protein [Bacteroidota bacterium]|nr:esterase family protein [Bacteroidota bacterium]